MYDPQMMAAPMPPMVDAGAAPAGVAGPGPLGVPPQGAMSPVEAAVMALKGMQVQRKGENDALMMAVLQATGVMPSGLGGVTEGSPMATPDDADADAGMGY